MIYKLYKIKYNESKRKIERKKFINIFITEREINNYIIKSYFGKMSPTEKYLRVNRLEHNNRILCYGKKLWLMWEICEHENN